MKRGKAGIRFILFCALPWVVHAAPDIRFGFVGTGSEAFAEKFGVPYYILEGNYTASGSVFSSVDPNNDPPAGHEVVRRVAKLNVRNDSLGQSNAQFQASIQAYAQSLATWYLFERGPKPEFTWYSPNTTALAEAESLQIVTTVRREKASNPAIKGTVWEIGNEPNLFPALLPSQYAALFSNYYRIIKSEDSTAKVAFGAIFLKETAQDLIPATQTLIQQTLNQDGALTLLGQVKFDSMLTDVDSMLFSRVLNLGTVEYIEECFSDMSPSIHPDYITFHIYPYNDRAPTLTQAEIQNKIDSLVSGVASFLHGRNFSAPVWVTEFGNINPALTATTLAANTSSLINIFEGNSGIGNWFYYKGTGADSQFNLLPGMSPALTRLAVDSAFNPASGNFSCSALNAIGQTYYLRAEGDSCQDTVAKVPPVNPGPHIDTLIVQKSTFAEGGSTQATVVATDSSDDSLRIFWTLGTDTLASGSKLVFKAGYSDSGVKNITVTVMDSAGLSVSRTFQVTILNTPLPPRILNSSLTTLTQNSTLTWAWNVLGRDPDLDSAKTKVQIELFLDQALAHPVTGIDSLDTMQIALSAFPNIQTLASGRVYWLAIRAFDTEGYQTGWSPASSYLFERTPTNLFSETGMPTSFDLGIETSSAGASILFAVPGSGDTRIRIRLLDGAGRTVQILLNGPLNPGRYHLGVENLSALGSGLYYVEMETPGFERSVVFPWHHP